MVPPVPPLRSVSVVPIVYETTQWICCDLTNLAEQSTGMSEPSGTIGTLKLLERLELPLGDLLPLPGF
jgi:hypothetical protein